MILNNNLTKCRNIINRNESIISLIKNSYENPEELYCHAQKIRMNKSSNEVYIRAVIDVSNFCVCSCKFCGNSSKTKEIKRYCLSKKDLKNAILSAKIHGIDMIHLASGEYPMYNYDDLISIVKFIKSLELHCEIAFGYIPSATLKKLREVGLERIILKFETSNKQLYSIYKTCHRTLQETIDYLKELRNMGFKIGSGNIVGFRDQSYNDLANDLLLLEDLGVSMASTSCLQPNKEQKIVDQESGDPKLTLIYLALIRTILSKENICIPTNSTFGKEGKVFALKIGANQISVNFTPEIYDGNYSIYTGTDRYKANFNQTLEIINEAGMTLSTYEEMRKKGFVQ